MAERLCGIQETLGSIPAIGSIFMPDSSNG